MSKQYPKQQRRESMNSSTKAPSDIAAIETCIAYAESGSTRGKPAGWHGEMIHAARKALRALASTEQASAAPAFTVPIEPSREWHWQVAERMKENTGPNSQPSGWFIGDVARYHRAMREVAAEQASAVSPPALPAELRAIVGQLELASADSLFVTMTLSRYMVKRIASALASTVGGALEQQQGHQSALAALAELVACQDLPFSFCRDDDIEAVAANGRNRARIDAAWEAARRVLAEGHQSERSETRPEAADERAERHRKLLRAGGEIPGLPE